MLLDCGIEIHINVHASTEALSILIGGADFYMLYNPIISWSYPQCELFKPGHLTAMLLWPLPLSAIS
jgi:hypothetical protein